MEIYKYCIVGGGMTAASAIEGIRSLDASGKIAVFSLEADKPYNRPPLSKGLWKGDSVETIFRDATAAGVDYFLGARVVAIDRDSKTISTESGKQLGYEKLLLATGGHPRKLGFDVEGIIYYRTLADYRLLRSLADSKEDFAVIGGGFIGTEIAAGLRLAAKNVTMFLPEAGLGARNYPPNLSEFITQYYRSKGVIVRVDEKVTSISKSSERYTVETESGFSGSFDGVVAGIGIELDTELATRVGLSVDNGIVVDEHCRTDDPAIYAAGDVARFFNPHLGKPIRVEHEDNANTMGRSAGRNMAGAQEAYSYLPGFYSDLFDLGYEAVGELDVRHQVVEDWKEIFKEGVIYYLSDSRVRGVLLWNVWGQLDAARRLIADEGPFDASSLRAKLPA